MGFVYATMRSTTRACNLARPWCEYVRALFVRISIQRNRSPKSPKASTNMPITLSHLIRIVALRKQSCLVPLHGMLITLVLAWCVNVRMYVCVCAYVRVRVCVINQSDTSPRARGPIRHELTRTSTNQTRAHADLVFPAEVSRVHTVAQLLQPELAPLLVSA